MQKLRHSKALQRQRRRKQKARKSLQAVNEKFVVDAFSFGFYRIDTFNIVVNGYLRR